MTIAAFLSTGASSFLLALGGIFLPILIIVFFVLGISRKSGIWWGAFALAVVASVAMVTTFIYIGNSARQFGMETEDMESHGTQTVSCSTGLLTLEVPASWRGLEAAIPAPEATLNLGSLVREEYLLGTSELRQDLDCEPSAPAPDAIPELVRDNITSVLTSVELGEIQEIPHPMAERAWRMDFIGKADGIANSFVIHLLLAEQSIHQLVFWTLPERRRRSFPIFDQVARSAVVLPPSQDKPDEVETPPER